MLDDDLLNSLGDVAHPLSLNGLQVLSFQRGQRFPAIALAAKCRHRGRVDGQWLTYHEFDKRANPGNCAASADHIISMPPLTCRVCPVT
jgi:hypothetical protein